MAKSFWQKMLTIILLVLEVIRLLEVTVVINKAVMDKPTLKQVDTYQKTDLVIVTVLKKGLQIQFGQILKMLQTLMMKKKEQVKVNHQTKINQKEIKQRQTKKMQTKQKDHSFLKMNKKTNHLLQKKFRTIAENAYKKMIQWLIKNIVMIVEYGLDA